LSEADVNQQSEKLDIARKEVAHLIHFRDRVRVVHFADRRAIAGKLRIMAINASSRCID